MHWIQPPEAAAAAATTTTTKNHWISLLFRKLFTLTKEPLLEKLHFFLINKCQQKINTDDQTKNITVTKQHGQNYLWWSWMNEGGSLPLIVCRPNQSVFLWSLESRTEGAVSWLGSASVASFQRPLFSWWTLSGLREHRGSVSAPNTPPPPLWHFLIFLPVLFVIQLGLFPPKARCRKIPLFFTRSCQRAKL